MGGVMTCRTLTKSSTPASYRYAFPLPARITTKDPSGVAVMLCGAGKTCAFPKILVLSARGVTELPTIFHRVPSDIRTCGPRWLLAMICGVIIANVALKGMGG